MWTSERRQTQPPIDLNQSRPDQGVGEQSRHLQAEEAEMLCQPVAIRNADLPDQSHRRLTLKTLTNSL